MSNIKSFAVIGLGRFGTSVAMTLYKMGHQVLAIDRREDRVSELADYVTHAIQMDTTDERAVSQLGIRNFDAVVLSVGDDIRSSILSTVLCKEQGAKKLICKAYDELHAKLLNKTGADKVIMPERESGTRLAHSLVSDNVLEFLELSDEYSITENRVPASWVNKSLTEINVRANFGISIIAIKRDKEIIVVVNPADKLMPSDLLVMVGANKQLHRIEEMPV